MADTKAYGLDLAGYSTKGSALAMAERTGDAITVTIMRGNVFAKQAAGTDNLATVSDPELNELKRLMKEAPIYVDVPIDLQGLPAFKGATKVADLTKRPIDQALGALPPLADKIGSYVARMQHLRRRLTTESGTDPLGTDLFETYPAASLKQSGYSREGYKGTAEFDGTQWIGVGAKKDTEQKKNNTLAGLLNDLQWKAAKDFRLVHDEFDAAICALTGLDNQLKGVELRRAALLSANQDLPTGYVILKSIPMRVAIRLDELGGQP
ncbi:MAG: DUF429 domain-containing protein [Planctomycetales bacterium]|nr:DUF429 domain-containing protein [Planctomycetales bacterium]